MSIYHICLVALLKVFIIKRAPAVLLCALIVASVLIYDFFLFYPLNVLRNMAGVVKFSNPMYNPQVVEEIKRQIAGLVFHGTMICEYRNGRVSNVSYSANSESEVMNIARAFIRTNPDIVCVRLPRFNVVMY